LTAKAIRLWSKTSAFTQLNRFIFSFFAHGVGC